jgi:tetratricopeptide (TPR) repeat protein
MMMEQRLLTVKNGAFLDTQGGGCYLPTPMLTIKKGTSGFAVFLSVLLLLLNFFLTGCGEPGPRDLLEGERLIKQAKYDAAIEKLNKAVEYLPQNAQAWNHLGLALHHARKFPEAAKAYEKALSLDRNLAVARYNLGSLYFEQNAFGAASDQFTTYTRLEPKNPEGWLKLGKAQMRQGLLISGNDRIRWLDAAKKNLEYSLGIRPSAEAYNAIGVIDAQRNRPRDAIQQFNNALRIQPNFSPALLNSAIVYQSQNDLRMALQKLREFQRVQPNAGRQVEEMIRQIELQLNPRPAAIVPNNPPQIASAAPAVVTNAIPDTRPAIAKENKPDIPVKSAPITTVAVAKTNKTPTPIPSPPPKVAPPPAKVEIVKVQEEFIAKPAQDNPPPPSHEEPQIQVAPSETPAAVTVASKNPEEKETEKPKRSFVKRLNPTTWFRENKSRDEKKTVEQSSETTPTESVAVTTPAPVSTPVSAPPKNITPLPKPTFPRYKYNSPSRPSPGNRADSDRAFDQGNQWQKAGETEKALEAYTRAAKIDPSSFEAQFKVGLLAFQMGNLPLCLQAYENALAISPDSETARYNFALALQRANYPQDSANELEKILARNSKDVRAHLALGNLYSRQLQNKTRAREHYQKVLELEPQHPDALAIRYWISAN